VGDGGREVAGEKTPTPESFSLENMESSSPESSAKAFDSSSAVLVSQRSGGVVGLLASAVDAAESGSGDDEEVSSMRIEGMVSLVMTGLSVVDAFATSTTPSVRAMTYDDISSIPRMAPGKMNRNAKTRREDDILATHDEGS